MIPKVDISDGTTHSTDAGNVRIVSKANMTAAFVKPASNKKKVTVPATVNVAGRTFKVAAIDAGAFKGKKTTTLIVKTKKLTKKSVKGSLKGSKIRTVKVKVGKKKVNKKYVKKYRKIFTKKNAGRKVTVK